jgi:NAD(P)-dependent dehydrogenase (short-subunit alcohol dehydrogenase family)
MGQMQGKVAIVTGGASSIGAACAATLAREGAKVVVTDLDDAGGEAVVDGIGSNGGTAVFLHQDVSVEESWPGVIEAAERLFGRLDVMVANAGIGIMCRAVEMSLADWRRQTAVNLDGVFLLGKIRCSRHAARGRRLDRHHVVGCRDSRVGWLGRLLRHQGRSAALCQSRRDGVCRSQ